MKKILLFVLIALLTVTAVSSVVAFAEDETISPTVTPTASEGAVNDFVKELCQLNTQGDKMSIVVYLLGKFDGALAQASNVTTSVQEQLFSHDGNSYSNVVARITKLGTTKQIVIGAHYDSVGAGAGDNAVGVATLYYTMKQLVAHADKIPFNVAFVAFDGEEDGLLGAKNFVNSMSYEEKLNTLVMFNVDSIALGDNLYLMCENKRTDLADLILAHADSITEKPYARGTYGSYLDSFGYGYYEFVQGSDHTPFRLEEIPIAFLFSGTYSSGSWNFDAGDAINSASDTFENLQNYDFVGRVLTVGNAIVDTVLDEQFPSVAENARSQLVNLEFWYNGWWPSLVVLGILVILAVFTFLYYRKLQKSAILGAPEIKTQKVFEKPDASEIFSFADESESKTDIDDIFTFKK